MSFTVIGMFDDYDAAQAAAEKLDALVRRIAQWHVNHPFKSEKLLIDAERMRKPSPPEADIAREYDVSWTPQHGWLAVPDMQDVDGVVSVLAHRVFLTGGVEAAAAAPFDTIMAKLGGAVMVDDGKGSVRVTLSADAPDEEMAASLHDDLRTFNEAAGYASIPWALYSGGERVPDADRLEDVEPVYMQYMQAAQQVEAAEASGDSAGAEAAREAFDALPELDEDDVFLLDGLREANAFYEAAIHRDGTRITVQDAAFEEIASGLPALMAWLRAAGCTVDSPILQENQMNG